MLPDQSWLTWRGDKLHSPLDTNEILNTCIVCVTVLHVVAICSTAFRFGHRRQKNRLWWDDYMALMGLLGDGSLMSTLWVWIDPHGTLSCSLVLVTIHL